MSLPWPQQVAAVTGLEAWDEVEETLLLDLARDVAHGTERRFAPLTAYAIGLAVGRVSGEGAGDAASRHAALRALVVAMQEAVTEGEP